MFYRTESGITEKASRETGALTAFYKQLSRRAHLLTTDKIGGVLPAAVVRSTRLCVGAAHQYFNYRYTRKEVIAYRHIPS